MKPFQPSRGWFVTISIFVAAMLLFMYWETVERYQLKPAINIGPGWTGMAAAGEIAPGFVLRQQITHDATDLRETEWKHPICLEIQFANYGNRPNDGNFSITVHAAGTEQTILAEAKHISDNALELFCFDRIRFDQIYGQEAWIDIKGIDSPRNRSVTAIISDLPQGHRAIINGQPTGQTLVYYVYISKDPEMYQINSLVLVAFAALFMTLLMFAPSWLSLPPDTKAR